MCIYKFLPSDHIGSVHMYCVAAICHVVINTVTALRSRIQRLDSQVGIGSAGQADGVDVGVDDVTVKVGPGSQTWDLGSPIGGP